MCELVDSLELRPRLYTKLVVVVWEAGFRLPGTLKPESEARLCNYLWDRVGFALQEPLASTVLGMALEDIGDV